MHEREQLFGLLGLEEYGTEEQKMKYLVELASGQKIGAFLLSEPEAGSDATSQRTTAVDMGDYYLMNGTKTGLPTATQQVIIWSLHKQMLTKSTRASMHSSLRRLGTV